MSEAAEEPRVIATREVATTLLNLEEAGAITPISLDLFTTDAELPFDTWESIGRWLGRVQQASSFWIGDWLIFGETLYGEDHAQAVEPDAESRYSLTERITGLAHQTLLNASSVCRRVGRERRREELPFGHHSVVAPLEPADQVEWLQTAIDKGWSVADLRAAIRDSKSELPPGGDDDASGGGGGTEPSINERVEQAASAVYTSAQATDHGVHEVPDPAIHNLGTALGRE